MGQLCANHAGWWHSAANTCPTNAKSFNHNNILAYEASL